MASSLQDQLRKAGLVTEKKANKLSKDQRRGTRVRRHAGQAEPVDQNRAAAQRKQTEKTERDRKLDQDRKAGEARKALFAQIKQLVQVHRIKPNEGEIGYHFTDQGKIKKIYITEATQRQLMAGQLTIVRLKKRYDIVPTDVAEKIRQRDANCIIQIQQNAATEVDKDDPYADYQVPDDLIW